MKKYTNTNWSVVRQIERKYKDIDVKEHFELKDVVIKEIATVKTTRHSKYNLNYHFVWVPKTRARILVGEYKEKLEEVLLQICKKNRWNTLAYQIMSDHIHFFLSAPPTWAPAMVIKELKQQSSKALRKKFNILVAFRKDNKFWADSYYVGCAGHVSAEEIAKYIVEQTKELKKDYKRRKKKLFSYDLFGQKKLSSFFTPLSA